MILLYLRKVNIRSQFWTFVKLKDTFCRFRFLYEKTGLNLLNLDEEFQLHVVLLSGSLAVSVALFLSFSTANIIILILSCFFKYSWYVCTFFAESLQIHYWIKTKLIFCLSCPLEKLLNKTRTLKLRMFNAKTLTFILNKLP